MVNKTPCRQPLGDTLGKNNENEFQLHNAHQTNLKYAYPQVSLGFTKSK